MDTPWAMAEFSFATASMPENLMERLAGPGCNAGVCDLTMTRL